MYSEQEREELDAEFYAQSELQNAYRLSQMELEPDDSSKIEELVANGRFVVFTGGIAYCQRTDASLGERRFIVKDFGTREEAEAFAATQDNDDCGDYWTGIAPIVQNNPPEPDYGDPSDIPF